MQNTSVVVGLLRHQALGVERISSRASHGKLGTIHSTSSGKCGSRPIGWDMNSFLEGRTDIMKGIRRVIDEEA